MRKAQVVPFECVARGYLAGSGYREYRPSRRVCGIPLPPGLDRASPLPEPIFTPATKAETGHDENVDFATVEAAVGPTLAAALRDLTLAPLHSAAPPTPPSKDLILADTKFEFGYAGRRRAPPDRRGADPRLLALLGRRPAGVPGEEPASFDKQFVRNWLDESGWDHESPPPVLPRTWCAAPGSATSRRSGGSPGGSRSCRGSLVSLKP